MPFIRRFKLALIAAATVVGMVMHAAVSSAAPAQNKSVQVALHKALYNLNMVSVESGAGIVGVKGKMYFEQDDACDAWTTDQRFTMEYQYPERAPVNNTNHYVAWESKDNQHFEFNSERQENGHITELLRGGVARGADGAAQAKYTRPGDLKFDLSSGYVLPVEHTNEIIRRARAGEKIFSAVMFDGTDADGPVNITVVIEKKATRAEVRKLLEGAGKIDMALLDTDAWYVRMAVFPLKDQESLTPAYEMEMILHDNGVVSYALVDYKTFKVEQRLKTLEMIPLPHCS
jgi:hypothetical protein